MTSKKNRMLGRTRQGSKIIWHNDPSGAKEVLIPLRPLSKYAKKPYNGG